jgi:hypothetical protein
MKSMNQVPSWWCRDDDEYLLDEFGHRSAADIAGELGVVKQFVIDRHAYLLTVRRRNQRKESQDAY